MGYRTEQRMCSSCSGYGSYDRTVYVSNPNSTGPFSIPVTKRETCLTCGGMGTKNHSVYEPDPVVPTHGSRNSSLQVTRPSRSIWLTPGKSLTPQGLEDLKKARVQTIAMWLGLFSGVACYFSTTQTFPAIEHRAIVSVMLLGVVYFMLTKPLRGLTAGVGKLVEVTTTVVRIVFKIAIGIGVIGLVLYVLKQMG